MRITDPRLKQSLGPAAKRPYFNQSTLPVLLKNKKFQRDMLLNSIICVLPSKALFLFFRKWGDVFDERPKSGKTMRYRVESCFIRFGTPDLPHSDLNRFLNKCNPEEVTSKRWKKVGFLPDFSRFFSEFFFFFSWAPSTNIFGGYKKMSHPLFLTGFRNCASDFL